MRWLFPFWKAWSWRLVKNGRLLVGKVHIWNFDLQFLNPASLPFLRWMWSSMEYQLPKNPSAQRRFSAGMLLIAGDFLAGFSKTWVKIDNIGGWLKSEAPRSESPLTPIHSIGLNPSNYRYSQKMRNGDAMSFLRGHTVIYIRVKISLLSNCIFHKPQHWRLWLTRIPLSVFV